MWTVKTGYDNGSYYLTTHQSYYYLTMFLALLFCSSTAIVTRRMAIAKTPTEHASVSAISLRHNIWLSQESHAGMSLPSTVLRVEAFGYRKRV